MSFNRERWTKSTRKKHRCLWCGGEIPAGSAACYASGTWEGDFWAGYFHPECAAAKDDVLAKYGEWEANEGHARGRMDDDITKPPAYSADYRGSSNPTENRTGHLVDGTVPPVVQPSESDLKK